MDKYNHDYITENNASNLSNLFLERVKRSPDKIAYQYYDESDAKWVDLTWTEMSDHIGRWQQSMRLENLVPGDRVAIMMKNSPQWVMCEQAALGLGLVVVPLYINDRAENALHILNEADVKLIFIDGPLQYKILEPVLNDVHSLKRIVCMQDCTNSDETRLQHLSQWVVNESHQPAHLELDPHSLSSIVYTSGTTGKPKGVMLSHGNILWNANACSKCYPFNADDIYLSFLPLSHMFERTVGYYLPVLTGATVAYARSIDLLGEDLVSRKPTILVTVPRIFERVYNKIHLQLNEKSGIAKCLFNSAVNVGWKKFQVAQKRERWSPALLLWPILNLLVAGKIMKKLGGNMRLAISGGAPLSFEVGRVFTGLGLTISQGYGMTEASPVVCTNMINDNEIASVGQALPDVEVRLGEHDELQVRSPGVMLGYWQNEQASKDIIDADGWLFTGDKASITNDHIYITGRLKEIIVLSNGEKVPPADIELAICTDPLFEQVMILGEGKPFISAIAVLNTEQYSKLCQQLNIDTDTDPNSSVIKDKLMQHLKVKLASFPGYTRIFRIHATLEAWTVENSMITPTLKLKRQVIQDNFDSVINDFYKGH